MFHKLAYSVTFASTGRTLKNDLTLEEGFWAITGPNEAGKSMIFEMMRFLLFGSAALRGQTDGYSSLSASGEFVIRNETYSCSRGLRKAELKRGEDVIATGVTAVNAKVVELLGFGLNVFDMACSINQGQVERLGSLTPLERKRMIDGVIGIDALDVVANWAMSEARVIDSEARGLKAALVAPIEPLQPADYVPAETLLDTVHQLRQDRDELTKIEGFLQVQKTQPVAPECDVDLPAENLLMFSTKRSTLRNEVASLDARIAVLPASTPYTVEQIDQMLSDVEAAGAAEEARRKLSLIVKPQYALTDLQRWKLACRRQDLEQHIEAHKSEGSNQCPHCGGDVPLAQAQILRLEEQLNEIPVTNETSPLSIVEIEAAERVWAAYDEVEVLRLALIADAAKPVAFNRSQLNHFRVEVEQVAQRKVMQEHLDAKRHEFEQMPDYEAMYSKRLAYEKALPAYQMALMDFEQWQAERLVKLMRREELLGVSEKLGKLEADLVQARDYETALAHYQGAKAAYDEEMERALSLEKRAASYRKIRDVMVLLRSLIKQHLLPSLNRVASHLLNGMTGGQRLKIVVDEDFNVMVDDQPLDTLSGSGKAVANLALRIALGQVLTNRVMSLLMADEIDASMDDFRAEQTSNILRTLDNSISQVLLISHKSIEAQNAIRLGGFVDQSLTDTGESEGDL